jgi:hypothetical protein
MAKGERGTSRPYLRGNTWWIRYTVPGERKERFESSESTGKTDALRLFAVRAGRPKSDGQSPNRSRLCLAGAPGDQLPIDSGVILLPHAALHRNDSGGPQFPLTSSKRRLQFSPTQASVPFARARACQQDLTMHQRPSRIWMCFMSGLDGIIATRKTAVSYRRGSGSARGVENSSAKGVPAEAALGRRVVFPDVFRDARGLFRAPLKAKPD